MVPTSKKFSRHLTFTHYSRRCEGQALQRHIAELLGVGDALSRQGNERLIETLSF
jgi:hypothetical protein